MQEPDKKYRIVKLSASNIKRLKAVEILPTGNVVSIGGKNDQGKTSVLDAIMFACAGAGTVCEQPIRHGATKGEITVDLGDMIITKTFRSSSAPTLKVNMKDGTPVSSPQSVLDALASKISYDPMEWLRKKPADQLEMLRRLVGLDFTPLDQKRKLNYDGRTLVNRNLEQKEASLATMPQHPDAPAEEVSVKALMAELTKANETNRKRADAFTEVEKKNETISTAQTNLQGLDKEISDIEELLARKKSSRDQVNSQISQAVEALAKDADAAKAMPSIDTAPINQRIEESDNVNAQVRENAARKQLTVEIADLQKRSGDITAIIEAVDKEKKNTLAEAKFPLPGLSFDDSGVLLDGVPFNQAGMAKKIRASVAIGLALNPKLRVILIRDGSLLDEDSMKALAETAEKEDAQVWLEVVGVKNVSVVIEDGAVRED